MFHLPYNQNSRIINPLCRKYSQKCVHNSLLLIREGLHLFLPGIEAEFQSLVDVGNGRNR
jgi:hypothetical protein